MGLNECLIKARGLSPKEKEYLLDRVEEFKSEDVSDLEAQMMAINKIIEEDASTLKSVYNQLSLDYKTKLTQQLVKDTKVEQHLTDDGEGNYVFWHYGPEGIEKNDPTRIGSNTRATGRDESRSSGTMFYTKPDEAEQGLEPQKYEVKVAKEKVYPIDEDPLNFEEEARKRWKEKWGDRAFSTSARVEGVGQIANEKGFEMAVSSWELKKGKTARAETHNELTLTPITDGRPETRGVRSGPKSPQEGGVSKLDAGTKSADPPLSEEAQLEVAKKVQQTPVTSLSSEDIDSSLDEDFAFVTAENPEGKKLSDEENTELQSKAIDWLEEKGYKPHKSAGVYQGAPEGSLFVPGMTKEDAAEFAAVFNQEEVAHKDGKINTEGVVTEKATGVRRGDFNNNYSIIKDNQGSETKIKIDYEPIDTQRAETDNQSTEKNRGVRKEDQEAQTGSIAVSSVAPSMVPLQEGIRNVAQKLAERAVKLQSKGGIKFQKKAQEELDKAERRGTRAGRKEAKGQVDAIQKSLRSVGDMIKEMENQGKITAKQAKALTNKALTLSKGLPNPKKAQEFEDYAMKVIQDAEYAENLDIADGLVRKIKKAKLSGYGVNFRSMRDAIAGVKPKHLSPSQVKDFIVLANEFKMATAPEGTKRKIPFNQADMSARVEELIDASSNNELESITRHLDIDTEGMTKEEIDQYILAEDADPHAEALTEAKQKAARDALQKQAEYSRMGLAEYELPEGAGGLPAKALKAIESADLGKFEKDDLVQFIRVVDNIIMNDNFSNVGGVIAAAELSNNRSTIETLLSNAKGTLGKIEQEFLSFPSILRKILNNSRLAAKFRVSTGIQEWLNSQTMTDKAEKEIVDRYNKLVKAIKKKHKNIRSATSVATRGMYSNLLQGTDADLQLNKDNMVDTINKLRAKGQEKLAKELSKVYDKLKDLQSMDEIYNWIENNDSGNKKLLDFWISEFNLIKEDLRETKEMLRNEEFVEVEGGRYLPRRVTSHYGPTMNELSEMKAFDRPSMKKRESSTTIARINNMRLSKDKILDLDFDGLMSSKYFESIAEINTLLPNMVVKKSMDDVVIRELLGNNRESFITKADEMNKSFLRQEQGKIKNWERRAAKIGRIIRKIATVIGLAGAYQFVKQFPSVVLSSTINLGKNAWLLGPMVGKQVASSFRKVVDKNYKGIQLLEMYSVGSRAKMMGGVERGDSLSKSEMSAMADGMTKALNWIEEKTQGGRDFFLKPLTFADQAAAESTWMSYYAHYLMDNGVKLSDINFNTEHLKIAEDPRRRDAAAFAEQKVGETQVPSNMAEIATFVKDKGGVNGLMHSLFLPFSSFVINAKGRMYTDLAVMRKTIEGDASRSDLKEAAASLSSVVVEQAIFNAIKIYGLYTFSSWAAGALAGLIDMEEEEKEVFSDENLWLWWSNSVSDVLVGGLPREMSEQALQTINRTMWYTMSLKDDSTPTFKDWEKENGIKYWKSRGGSDDYGVYGLWTEQVGQLTESVELAVADEATIENDWGGVDKYDLTKKQQRFMMLNALNESLSLMGMTDADLTRILHKVKRNIKKDAKLSKKRGKKSSGPRRQDLFGGGSPRRQNLTRN